MAEPASAPAPVDPKRIREIKIKSGVVKRLAKEKISYEQESEKLSQKISKMKADGGDEYTIKKQQELLEESKKMVPDCERRLITAWDELAKIMETEKDLKDTDEFKAAEIILNDAKAAAKKN